MWDNNLIQWFLITVFLIFVLFVVIRAFFYKSIAEREERNSASMKLTLREAEILIQKHQLQLQRALGNIDLLTQELNNLKNELKIVKQRNTQYRMETDKYKARIKDLEQKIEALL
ncbi:hypothetical protein [Helicobacter mustelae]|uniref:Putative inner membrane protein n=1 Tax=Helicobacter mustelae (strain ATCC 43772 / CCUG 25715 / CIP 103759 / LMG 18044 / NCTC 12198 / R85-136P) TaxID=679897 RepID=D3UHD5_HELM1|nr:hypothetical protein [Helicobacter mustelae]CBG39907.1 putative inner membrane protein [Helicobacter mustelae 12198]SQH71418.1 putative inner membrane protein [Helicobacter mustelae]STP12546.1 putative inner membrane protein [Helicobacter mustelae]